MKFNRKKFSEAINEKIGAAHNLQLASIESGVEKEIIRQVLLQKGYDLPLNIYDFIRLCDWLELPINHFVDGSESQELIDYKTLNPIEMKFELSTYERPEFLQVLSLANRERNKQAFGHSIEDWNLEKWCLAVVGEAGELAAEVKKLISGHWCGNTDLDGSGMDDVRAMIGDEAADIAIYLDLFCQRAGINLQDAIIRKFNMVSEKKDVPIFLSSRVQVDGKSVNQEHSGNAASLNDKNSEFLKACRPLIQYICENHDPHTTAIVTPTGAELLQGVIVTGVIMDYVKD